MSDDVLEGMPELPRVLSVVNGGIRIAGHRISLYHIADCWKACDSLSEVSVKFPTLKRRDIAEVFAFCESNQAFVERYCDRVNQQAEALRVANESRGPTTEELRNRRSAIG